MKKFTYTITLLVFAFFFIGCEKETMIEQPVVQENEMIPIAKLTAQNDIQHLFLQKDMQASFLDNQGGELVFMEVVDNNKNGENAGLLYRIYNREQGVVTTTLMTSVLTLKGDTYYYDPIDTRGSTIMCTALNLACSVESKGCIPEFRNCTKCSNGAECYKTIKITYPSDPIIRIIRKAVAAY